MSKAENKIRKEMETDYPLIPMMEIEPEARMLAVAWVDGYEAQGMDIPGKQKLASDIMNYARRHQSPSIPDAGGLVESLQGHELPQLYRIAWLGTMLRLCNKEKVYNAIVQESGGDYDATNTMLTVLEEMEKLCTQALAQYNAVEPEKGHYDLSLMEEMLSNIEAHFDIDREDFLNSNKIGAATPQTPIDREPDEIDHTISESSLKKEWNNAIDEMGNDPL